MIDSNPIVVEVVDRVAALDLPDTWVVSGCLFQTVWNVLAGQDPTRAIKYCLVAYADARNWADTKITFANGSGGAGRDQLLRILVICFILGFSILAGCAGSDTVRISTESEAAFDESLEAMQRTLSQEEQLKLMVALLQVRMSGVKSATHARASTKGRQVLSADELRAINGLTYPEILEVARLAGIEAEVMR